MPTIRIDEEVWRSLQSLARPFEDTPNDVLRRVLNLDPAEKVRRGAGVAVETIGGKTTQPDSTALQRTPQQAFRRPILEALVALGGQAEVSAVIERVREEMKAKLTRFDLQDIRSGMVRWEKAANWERFVMVEEGLLEAGTPRGIWKISERGRKYLGHG